MTEVEIKELRREIYSLRKIIRSDIRQVKNAAKDNHLIPQSAINQMRKLEQKMRQTAVSKMTGTQLRSTYRGLMHIHGLKSGTLEGATKVAERLQGLLSQAQQLTPQQLRKTWEVYHKLVEQSAIFQKYKYEILEVVPDVVTKTRLSADELAIRIEKLYDQTVRGVVDEKQYKSKTSKMLLQNFGDIFKKRI